MNQTTLSPDESVKIFISLEEYSLIARYVDLVIFPIVAIVGLVGNALSGFIVFKNGLNKPSNVLLLGLAVSDFFMMFDYINIPNLLFYASPSPLFWVMDLNSINICYNALLAIHCITSIANGMTTTLTVLITLERIVAVFFPLQFSTLVTPCRAKIAVLFSCLVTLPYTIFHIMQFELLVVYSYWYGWLGLLTKRKGWIGSEKELYDQIVNWYIIPIIPTTLVSVGCILIGAKVSVTIRLRKAMTSNTRNRGESSRTRTLFMVCSLFSITRFSYFFIFIPQLNNYDFIGSWYYVARLYAKFVNFLTLCNSACNFFIYVILNAKFRNLILLSIRPMQEKFCQFERYKKIFL